MTAVSILNQEECMRVLGPHLGVLHDIIHEAFAKYQAYSPEALADHDERAAAACVHSHIITAAGATFGESSGAILLDARGLKVLNVGDRVVARFKKVDEDGRSRSYPTRQAKNFDKQLPLPNLPNPAARLTIGYEPDIAFTAIQRVVVSCPLGPSILWCSQVLRDGEESRWIDITPQRFTGTEGYRRYEGREGQG
ncbi:MAG: hypothetical protein HQL39_01360 [Alphaproteobacteria bacterium]|nr:hypothetical protein [Alphaproteobacteria bacterium]